MKFRANPFESAEPKNTISTFVKEKQVTKKSIIKSSEDYGESMRVAASFSAEGWGASAKASASYDTSKSFSSNDVIFMLHSHANLGFRGWNQPPPLSEFAKSLICKDTEFVDTYGTYYVKGARYGISLDINV